MVGLPSYSAGPGGRAAQWRRLQGQVTTALDTAMRLAAANGAAQPEAEVLLSRLREIQVELNLMRDVRSPDAAAELYPFWLHLARGAGR